MAPLAFMIWPLASFPATCLQPSSFIFVCALVNCLLFLVSCRYPALLQMPFSTLSALENFYLFFSIQLANQLSFEVFSGPMDCFLFCGLVIPHFIEWSFLLQSSSLTRISFLCLLYTLS